MADIAAQIDARQAIKPVEMTVRLTGVHQLYWRIGIGLWFIRLGVRIIGCQFRLDMGAEYDG